MGALSAKAKPHYSSVRRVVSGQYLFGFSKPDQVFTPNGKIYLVPVPISKPVDISALCCSVQTLVAAKSIRLGLYSDLDGSPDELLLDAGTASFASTGVKEVAASLSLAPGIYWGALLTDSTATGVVHACEQYDYDFFSLNVSRWGASNSNTGLSGAQAWGALPSVLPALSEQATCPASWLKVA